METELTREEKQALDNKRTGLALFQASWIMVFVCLIVVNIQLRTNFTSWPPPGVEELNIILPTIATVLLFVSGWFARQGLVNVKQDDIAGFLSKTRIVLGLGVVFVAIMAFEWITVPSSGQYSTLFKVMTAFHVVHSLAIGVFYWLVYQDAREGTHGSDNFWVVEAAARLWYFVIVAWLLFYVVLYWI